MYFGVCSEASVEVGEVGKGDEVSVRAGEGGGETDRERLGMVGGFGGEQY